jgi:hypothetical protein
MYIVPNYLGKYNDTRPYTYMWLRENGVPMYVGKGTGERAFKKRRIGSPPSRDRIILQEFETHEDALQAEMFLIAFYGREDLGQGPLLNLTDGGDQPPNHTGFKRRPESIQKFINSRRGKSGWKHSLETRKRLSEAQKGRSRNKGVAKSLDHRAKISRTLKEQKIGFQSGYIPWNKGKKKYSICTKGRPWTEARRAAFLKGRS